MVRYTTIKRLSWGWGATIVACAQLISLKLAKHAWLDKVELKLAEEPYLVDQVHVINRRLLVIVPLYSEIFIIHGLLFPPAVTLLVKFSQGVFSLRIE